MDIQIDLSNTVINTPRLLLRPWEESDLHDFFEYASADGVGEMAGWKHHESIEESKVILDSFIADKNVFAVELKSNKKVIGSLGLHYSWANNDQKYAALYIKEIGYVLSKTYWGQGLMPEAVKAVIKHCFDTLNFDALTAGHFTENNQSKRVIEKCGFKYVKQGEFNAKDLNKIFEVNHYVLYKDEFRGGAL